MANKYLVPLFGKLVLPDPDNTSETVNPEWVASFNLELASLGYTLTSKSLKAIKGLSSTMFIDFRAETLSVVNGLAKIPNVKVLFNKFPYEVPDDREFLLNRISSFFQQYFHRSNAEVMSCGHVIEADSMDPDDFGVCPICLHEVDELDTPVSTAKYSFKNVSPLKQLQVVTKGEVKTLGEKTLGRNGSLSQQEKDFVISLLLDGEKLTLPKNCFKETLPFIYDIIGDTEYVKAQLSGATDVMRLAYYVSNETSDLSLAENAIFKFKKKHVRDFCGMLEDLPNLEEDLMRHRERWLRFGEVVHIGAKAKKYPKLAAAFKQLRQSPKDIMTFARRREIALANNNMRVFTKILASRPGEFARSLDIVIRSNDDSGLAMAYTEFCEIIDKIQTKVLFELRSYLNFRRTNVGGDRVFFIKGGNKYHIRPETRHPLGNKVDNFIERIDRELLSRFENKETLGSVYIDPSLKGLIVPFNRRGDSTKSENILSKGSRIPFHGKVIRLFVWWKGDIDVDLSANFYDENWKEKGYVAYTNLSNAFARHSGDIVNAPNGATEFIDIDVSQLKKNQGRYLVASAISFRGQKFATFPCFAGFMERDSLTSGKLFEPQSVATKMDIDCNATRVLTFAFDIFTKEVILMDLTSGGGRHHGAHNNHERFRSAAKAVCDLSNRKPTFYDVLSLYGAANGKLVDSKKEADTVFHPKIDVQKIYDLLA